MTNDIKKKLAILVPVGHHIEKECDEALRTLEMDGVKIYRRYGFSAIDQARCVMAQIAINDGYEHLFWIDSDISFFPYDVYKVVDKNVDNKYPFITGAYSVKGWPKLTTTFKETSDFIKFGETHGSLVGVKWAATGFMYTHKSVYEKIVLQYNLKQVYIWGVQYLVYPWFFPMIMGDQYVGEDFAFCERANNSGIEIYCDTTIRLSHIGKYGYSFGFLTRHAPENEPKNILYNQYELNKTTIL